jgi:hypothetical protein
VSITYFPNFRATWLTFPGAIVYCRPAILAVAANGKQNEHSSIPGPRKYIIPRLCSTGGRNLTTQENQDELTRGCCIVKPQPLYADTVLLCNTR